MNLYIKNDNVTIWITIFLNFDFRCKIPSPIKILRTPLKNRNDIINTTSVQTGGPIKLDLDIQLESRPDIPECHIVAKELSPADTENIWKNVALDKYVLELVC